ncbi:MAG: alpha-galactosidase, partial [Clostridia bacterium]|nr:alpha-galactosidase [Clostridia bacterium]
LMPLIESAAEAGCEVFCIDAGWFGKRGEWYKHNGDWQPYNELFGEGGLPGILNEIKSRGMLPGVWLEIETADACSDFAMAHPEALLTRHGHPIGRGQCFVDFRKQVVRDHLMKVFDNLYDLGVRFIKNDYNHSTGIGIDPLEGVDESMAEALREHTEAFYEFVDEVISTHPGLMIENCGSGAMRCDHTTLSHFHIQSTSDQEYYDRYPSIIQGMVACMPPERAGIWAYSYPVDFHQMPEQGDVYPVVGDNVKAMIQACADGNQTVFNMVNGMMGAMYLSGRICYADELNRKLMADAISIYKENRNILARSVPVYPAGLSRMSHEGHTALGLLNSEEGKLLLAVWQVHTDLTETVIDLTSYVSDDAFVIRTYPDLAGYTCSLNDGYLTVEFPAGNCATYIEIML